MNQQQQQQPAIQNCKRISHAVQLLLHLANDVARTQLHKNYLCQECGGYHRGYGRIEVHSFLLKRKKWTLEARFEVLEMLEVKEDRWFGRLDDGSPKVKWMRRVNPQVDHTQAPWTRLLYLASTLRGGHRRFAGGSVFHASFRGLVSFLVGHTEEALVSSFATVVQSLIPHNNNYYIHQV